MRILDCFNNIVDIHSILLHGAILMLDCGASRRLGWICGPLEQWLPAFMQNVAIANNLPLQRSTTATGLDVHKWKAVMAYSGAWTGKVIVQLATQEELHRLHASLRGKGVEIQQHLAGISVDSLHVDLESHRAGLPAQSA